MPLQYMIGKSGSGKSWQLYRKIIAESIRHPEINYLVLVPEQFTMQTQNDLVSMHPRKGIMNIDVLSFQRLAYRVFEEVGGDHKKVLEETGKSLILRKIAEEQKDELKVLGRNLRKIGYISEIKSVISELTQYDIGRDDLEGMMELAQTRPGLYRKLEDISVLYERFRSYLEEKYITTEEILDVLSQICSRSAMIKNAVIALDGFTGFTPIQYKLLEKLMLEARLVLLTVTCDPLANPFSSGDPTELFHMSKETIHKLGQISRAAGIEVQTPYEIKAEYPPRFRQGGALAFLESHLFRYDRAVYKGEQQEISIHEVPNPREEVLFAGRTIRQLVRDEGLRYNEIAIVTGDMERYLEFIEKEFPKFEIPCFLDHKRSILLNPFIEFIRAVLEMVDRNYTYESVFRFLRCGLLDFSVQEIDMLENYVLALGIKGRKKWSEKWVRSYRGLEAEELEHLNELRQIFYDLMEPLRAVLKSKKRSIRDFTETLYHFIEEREIQLKLKRYEEQFQDSGQMALAKEYSQVYRIVIELFDKVVDLIGEEYIPLKEYAQILDAGFEEAKVGIIPPGMDQVLVGDIQRTRLNHIKVLFFIGVNDGIIPKSENGGGIISELDREFLAGNEIHLAPTMRENSYIQKFYLYLSLTKPSRRLYLSYSKVSAAGDALRPSYLIFQIERMFPEIERRAEEVYEDLAERIATPGAGLSYLLEGLEDGKYGQASRQWMELYSWYYRDDAWREKLKEIVEAAFYEYRESVLGRAAARALYGETLENSVTRLEQFAQCAFAHFLQYGLHLWEREEYGFEAVDMGNVFHEALEIYSKKLRQSGYTWQDIPDEVREKLLEESVEEAVTDYGNTVLYSSARNRYMIRRIKRMAGRTVWALSEQMKRGRFSPSHYEVSFSMEEDLEAVNILLSNEERMRLKGRIDRTDTYEKENEVYLKVIDYKSGNQDFDIVALYHGLQLQLVVYLNAAMEITRKEHPGKEVIPAGIFYYNMKDPVIDKEKGAADVQEELLRELRMRGLVNKDPEVISYMDDDIRGKSTVLPVSTTPKGTIRKSDSLASREQLERISAFVNEKIREIGEDIMEGKVGIHPYEWNGRTACDYCEYGGICGFDARVPGFEMRRLENLKAEEVWKKLEEGESEDGHEMDT